MRPRIVDAFDVRALGPRLARLVVSLVVGTAGALAITAAFPRRGSGMVWGQLALVTALACGLAVGCFAILETLRRRVQRVAAPLPVARARFCK